VMVLLIAHGLIMRDAYPNHGSACATVTGTNVLFDGVTRYQEKMAAVSMDVCLLSWLDSFGEAACRHVERFTVVWCFARAPLGDIKATVFECSSAKESMSLFSRTTISGTVATFSAKLWNTAYEVYQGQLSGRVVSALNRPTFTGRSYLGSEQRSYLPALPNSTDDV